MLVLALSLLAYNLGNLWRLALPQRIRELVADEPAATASEDRRAAVKHARYSWLLLAEGHLSRRRFGAMLGRIAVLAVPTGSRR